MKGTRDKTKIYIIPHDAPGTRCIVTKRESMGSLKPYINLRHRQQSHNKGLYYGFKDAILSYLIPMHPYKVVRPSVRSYNLETRAF